jgi:acetylornithine deacetylase
MKSVCKALTGKERVIGVPYGSDASKIATIGIPSIVFGPGDIANAHSANEYVNVDELEQAELIYRSLILKYIKMN